MPPEEIIKELERILIDPFPEETKENQEIISFLQDLKPYFMGQKLLLCMAIDLLCGAIDPLKMREVIALIPVVRANLNAARRASNMPERTFDPSRLFMKAIEFSGPIYSQKSGEKLTSPIPFVHFLRLSSFLRRTIPEIESELDIPVLKKDEEKSFWYYLNYRLTGKKYYMRNHRKAKVTDPVFVTTLEDYMEDIGDKPADMNMNTYLGDSLGLYFDSFEKEEGGNLHLVAMIYDENFDRPCYQPCCFNADWGKITIEHSSDLAHSGNPYFLSHSGEEGFGRTYCPNPALNGKKEKIHEGFENSEKTYTFEFRFHAEPYLSSHSADYDAILKCAADRLKDLL